MKILYYGTICNLEEYERTLQKCRIKPTIASVLFESALLEGFYQNGADVEILTCPMISNFYDSKILYWGRKQEQLECGYTCKWLRTLNVIFLKQISRRLDGKAAIKAWLEKNRGEDCVIVSYGISPFLTKEILSLSKKYGAKCCAIVPDLPRDMFLNSSKHGIKAWLRQLYLKPVFQIQGDFDGYVYLTKAMAEVISSKKPYIVMEGILKESLVIEQEPREKEHPRGIMYAGGLNEKYGILQLLDAFELADIPNTELWLFGDGNATSTIQEREKNNPRIHLFGRRSRAEVLAYEQRATLLVNPRSVQEDYTRYSFPSKTIEYMYSGTPLLTTKLQGIPEEYFQYVFTAEDNTVESLSSALTEVFSLSDQALQEKGQCAKAYVAKNKNPATQSERVLTFLNSL